MNPAGTAAGAVMNAAKLGIATATVACLGKDSMGDLIVAEYRRMGIDCSMLQRSETKRTSAAFFGSLYAAPCMILRRSSASSARSVAIDLISAICCGVSFAFAPKSAKAARRDLKLAAS